MKYKHKTTGNIAELTQSGKNYKVSYPQNYTIPKWIIESSSDWEPITKEYQLEYKDLHPEVFYTTECTYSNQETNKYTFLMGHNLWYNHKFGQVINDNSNFNPEKGFSYFREAKPFESLPILEKKHGYRIVSMQFTDGFNLYNVHRQLNNNFQNCPEDTQETGEFSLESLLLSGWVISKVRRESDGEEFKLGDTFKSGANGNFAKIIEFYFKPNMSGILVRSYVNSYTQITETLERCIKKTEVLLKTDDNIELYKGDNYIGVTINFQTIDYKAGYDEKESIIKRFVSLSKATDFIIRNKPCLSLEDVAKVYVTANSWDPEKPENNRKQPKDLYMIVKKKLGL